MVLITDGAPAAGGFGALHAYISKTAGDMENFVAAKQSWITEHPPFGSMSAPYIKGDFAKDAGQIAFIPDGGGNVVGVSYTLWNGVPVKEKREYHGKFAMSMGYTHTVYNVSIRTPPLASLR